MSYSNFHKEWRAFCTRILKDKTIRIARIAYKGSKGSSQSEWHKIRNPIRLLFCAAVFEVLRKTPPCELKNQIYRLFGAKIGKNVAIAYNVLLDPLYPELIAIGNNVMIGSDCEIATHEFVPTWFGLGRVVIEDNVMIAAYNVIAAGTTIGKGSWTALNTYVRSDIGSNEFWAGIPAKLKKEMPKGGFTLNQDVEVEKYEGINKTH